MTADSTNYTTRDTGFVGSGETRRKLLDGAARAIEKHGLADLRVGHILECAGLSRRTLYLYFESKDEVLLALYEGVVTDLADRIRDAVDGAEDSRDQLFAGTDAYLDFQMEGGRLVTLLQAEAAKPDSLMNPAREATIDALVRLIEDGVAELGLDPIDPLAYRVFFVAIESLVIGARRGGDLTQEARDRIAGVIKPLFLRLLTGLQYFPPPPTADGHKGARPQDAP